MLTIAAIAAAYQQGQHWQSFLHKTSAPVPTAGAWSDLSMGAGIPFYNAYIGAPLEFTPLIGEKNKGINCGPIPPDGSHKYLSQIGLMSTSAPLITCVLCDYLGFYPLLDGDTTEQQDLDNTASFPRYSDGVGVRAFIIVTSPIITSGTITIAYTDADDIDRTTVVGLIASSVTGAILNTANDSLVVGAKTPFISIAGRGIKRINSVTNTASLGGFFCIVLVRPLTTILLRETSVYTEHCLISQKLTLPRIEDGAYLNLLSLSSGTTTPAPLRGQFDFIWG